MFEGQSPEKGLWGLVFEGLGFGVFRDFKDLRFQVSSSGFRA